MDNNLPSIPTPGESPIIDPHNLTPQVFQQLVSNQTRDLELKAAELALQQQKDTNGYTYAIKALDAQVSDRKDDRIHQQNMRNMILIFAGVISVVITALIAYALTSGHEAFASEFLKLIGYVGVGIFGGYGYGKRSVKPAQNDESNDS